MGRPKSAKFTQTQAKLVTDFYFKTYIRFGLI